MIRPGRIVIVFLSGYIEAGKDTLAAAMGENKGGGFFPIAFADSLKRKVQAMNPWIMIPTSLDHKDVYGPVSPMRVQDALAKLGGWDNLKKLPEGRQILQQEGQSTRKYYGYSTFCRPVSGIINQAIFERGKIGCVERELLFVVKDTRQLFEPARVLEQVDYPLSKLVVLTIWVDRDGKGPINQADSEKYYAGLKAMSVLTMDNNYTPEVLADRWFMKWAQINQERVDVNHNKLIDYLSDRSKKLIKGASEQWELINLEQLPAKLPAMCEMRGNHEPVNGGTVCRLCLRGSMR